MKAEFTPRELQVLKLMAESKHNKEIAVALSISEHTAKFHVNSVLAKTRQTTRLGAVIACLKRNVITLHDVMPHIAPILTMTAIAITEENRQAMEEQKNNMIENITNDICEELFDVGVTPEEREKITGVLKEYFNA